MVFFVNIFFITYLVCFSTSTQKTTQKDTTRIELTIKQKDSTEIIDTALFKANYNLSNTYITKNDSLSSIKQVDSTKDNSTLTKQKSTVSGVSLVIENLKDINEDSNSKYNNYLSILLIIIISYFIFYQFRSQKKNRKKVKHLGQEIDILNKKISVLNDEKVNKNIINDFSLKKDITETIQKSNILSSKELQLISAKKENRWLTVAHSAIGKSHITANPPIPCQDNNFFKKLNKKWELAIVCDGAGSAKMSHYSSKFLSNEAIPLVLNSSLENLNWFKQGKLPSNSEWKELSISILKEVHGCLETWVTDYNKKNKEDFLVKDFASTVIVAIYNSKGVITFNIGDGRGGYLNSLGYFKSLFNPFRGEESNGTIFITSPIWKKPDHFIQSNVINENILSIFLLSDGMEKITFECSNFTNDIFVDPNIPYKKFFYPILLKLNTVNKDGEDLLRKEWITLLEKGNQEIINEPDDKTLIVSYLK